MSLDHPDVLLVRKHLVEHLGPPDEVFEVSGSPIPGSPVQALNLAYFAPAGPQSPVVFATCGASQFTMADGRRAEALAILRREPDAQGFDGINRLLGTFALFSESSGQPVRIGDVVRAPTELKLFCAMDAVLFLPPVPFVPKFHQVQVTRNKMVEMIWLLPVYESEAAYALRHGPQALMMLFAAQELDVTEPQRAEANTLVMPEDAEGMAKRVAEENQKKAAGQPQTPVLQVGKTKTSRRDIGRGSFDVEEGASVTIARRVKPAPAPEAATPPPRAETPTPTSADTTTTAKAERRPAFVKVDPPKNEVRFDLGSTPPPKKKPQSDRAIEAQPRESPEAQKKRRFEELKANARSAAERAEVRKAEREEAQRSGRTQEQGEVTATSTAINVDSAKAASRRRGAPSQVIQQKIKGSDSD